MSQPSKITGDKDKFVTDWFDEISRGIRRREEEETRWEENERYENMHQWGGELGEFDQSTINKLGSYIRNYRAQVAYNNPQAKLTPATSDGWKPIQVPVAGPGGKPEVDEMGQVVVKEVIPVKARESLLNSIVSAPMQHIQQTSGLLTKAGIIGWGCLKVGFTPTFKTEPKIEGDQAIPIVAGNLDLSQFKRNRFDDSLVEDDSGRLITNAQIPIWEDFFVRWTPYRDMIIDPDGGNYWDDHRWVCEESIRDLEEVKDDPKFKNTSDLEQSGTPGEKDNLSFNADAKGSDWSAPTEEAGSSARKSVKLYHLYDLVNRRYIVLADGHGKALRDVSWTEIKLADHPYSDFRPTQILGEFYQRPIATDLAPINTQYNILSQMEIRGAKNSTRKVFTRKGVLNQKQLDQLMNDDDMAVVEFDIPSHKPLTDTVMPYVPPNVNASIYIAKQSATADFAEVGGMTDEARGKATADTATQVNTMEQYSGTRIAHDRKILAETWRVAFKKLNDSIDANMTKERAVQVQGTDGESFQALLDLDMIAGDFEVSVDFEDMAPANSAMQNAGKIQILQLMAQAPEQFMTDAAVRGWLEPYGIKDQNFIDSVIDGAKMRMQMLMMQAQGQQSPANSEAAAPESEADAISQSGAGQQVPRMRSAS